MCWHSSTVRFYHLTECCKLEAKVALALCATLCEVQFSAPQPPALTMSEQPAA